jgi:hypothetical protein
MTGTRTTLCTVAADAIRQLVGFAASGGSPEAQLQLAATPSGRIALHLLCAWRDHRYGWHWRGVARELARV